MTEPVSKRRERLNRRQATAAAEEARKRREQERRRRESAEELEAGYLAVIDALIARDLPTDDEEEIDLSRFDSHQTEATLELLQALAAGTVLVPQSQIRRQPDISQELQELRAEVARFKGEADTARQTLADRDRELRVLQGNIQTAADDVRALQAQASQFIEERTALHERLTDMERERNEARANLGIRQDQLDAEKHLNGELQDKNATLERELRELRDAPQAPPNPPSATPAPAVKAANAVKRAAAKAVTNLGHMGSGPSHR